MLNTPISVQLRVSEDNENTANDQQKTESRIDQLTGEVHTVLQVLEDAETDMDPYHPGQIHSKPQSPAAPKQRTAWLQTQATKPAQKETAGVGHDQSTVQFPIGSLRACKSSDA